MCVLVFFVFCVPKKFPLMCVWCSFSNATPLSEEDVDARFVPLTQVDDEALLTTRVEETDDHLPPNISQIALPVFSTHAVRGSD